MIKELLDRYNLKTEDDYYNALREILQEIAIAGLYRANFFEKAAFYGGTCLRVFYGIKRYSEDLDFSLLKTDRDFSLDFYFEGLKTEFRAFGVEVDIRHKQKTNITAIESAFLKSNTVINILTLTDKNFTVPLNRNKKIKIKFEVDTNPPLKFETEEKLLLKPFSCFIKCFSLPDLFAGKMHALLFRKWKNRVKGRDWYDFEWYVTNSIELSLGHLSERAIQSGDIELGTDLNKNLLYSLMIEKINSLDLSMVKSEVYNFVEDQNQLDIWTKEYFLQLVKMIKFKHES